MTDIQKMMPNVDSVIVSCFVVIIVIAYYVIAQPWRAASKYWLVLLPTMLVCVLMYEVIRRVAALRFLFGMKPGKRAPDAVIDARVSSRIEAS